MSHNIQLCDNSIFIADSHYNIKDDTLYKFLLDLQNGKIWAKTLDLTGDIFDFLTYEIIYFKTINQKVIDLLNILSHKIQIIYLEGNHDFNLDKIFPNILIIPREKQPFMIKYGDKNIALLHGDRFTQSLQYEIYAKVIRNKYLLKLLNFFDIFQTISKNVEKILANKDICNKQQDFEIFVKNRMKYFDGFDIVIEGHYHKGKQYIFGQQKYFNIPSFYCQKEYLVFADNTFKKEKYVYTI